MPRTTDEVREWLSLNIDAMMQVRDESSRKCDPEFVESVLKRCASSCEHSPGGRTLECLDGEFAFNGKNSQPVWVLVEMGFKNASTWPFQVPQTKKTLHRKDLKASMRSVCSAMLDHVPEPNLKLLELFTSHAVKVHCGFCGCLVDTETSTGVSKFEMIVKEIFSRLKDPKNEGCSLQVTGHSLGKRRNA